MKADCPEPQSTAFRGECRACGQEGHRATDCPDKPAAVCSNCKEDGHTAHECKKNRVLSRHHVADKLPDEAWQILTKASEEKDIDDFKEVRRFISVIDLGQIANNGSGRPSPIQSSARHELSRPGEGTSSQGYESLPYCPRKVPEAASMLCSR